MQNFLCYPASTVSALQQNLLSHNEFDETLQHIQRLTPSPYQPSAMFEAIRAATDFVVHLGQRWQILTLRPGRCHW